MKMLKDGVDTNTIIDQVSSVNNMHSIYKLFLGQDGNTALHIAASDGRLDVVKMLLIVRADILILNKVHKSYHGNTL